MRPSDTPQDHASLDVKSSLDSLEIKLAPVWSIWSQRAVHALMYVLYLLGIFVLVNLLEMTGLSGAVNSVDALLDQRPLIFMLLVGLPLIVMELFVLSMIDDWITGMAREWRPAMTLTQGAIQLGSQAPIPLSTVRTWSVEPRLATINDKKARIRLTPEACETLRDVLSQAIARNQPDGPVDHDTVPAPLQQMRSAEP